MHVLSWQLVVHARSQPLWETSLFALHIGYSVYGIASPAKTSSAGFVTEFPDL